MKFQNLLFRKSVSPLIACALCWAVVPFNLQARQGATDPIPGTSKGGTSSGGGSNSNKTTTPVVVSAPLAFTAAASVNGVVPVCTGSYHIDPYYPTLSLMTIDVQASSVNVDDGTPLYITINIAGGTGYPFTSNVIPIVSQAGTCSFSEYVTPGTVITSVVISDASGAIIFAGN